jgi:malonate-semialdehyde dehydrogenase (acetylating)/methylmalonate-semialdehyde dehydrogenase
LLNSRKEELAAILTAEHGRVLSDALGEVTRGQEVVEFACGIPHWLKGSYTENASTNVDVHSAIISPFNFPAMVPMWFFPIAIGAGNTVVIKPSEKDSLFGPALPPSVRRGTPSPNKPQASGLLVQATTV